MISVNLLPLEERVIEHDLGAAPRVKFLLPLAIAVALIVPAAGFYWQQENHLQTLRRDIQVAEQEQLSLQPRIQMLEGLKVKQADLERRLNLVRDLNRSRTFPVRAMDELCLQIPQHLWLTKMRQGEDKRLLLEGLTFSNLVVAELMRRLEETAVYDNVDLTITERKQSGEDRVIHFTVTADVVRAAP
ncbi:MAG: PilN domain-containing protein [Candidatus Eisenbacteria bacterium]